VRGGTEVLAEALRRLEGSGVEVLDVGLRRPDLDDVFLTLTGHAAEEARDAADEAQEADRAPTGREPAPTAGSAR
jgi:ABC-2 type transport system ATP-binding protein